MVQFLVLVMVILPKFYDGLLYWVCFANGLLGAYADGYAFGQLDGEFFGRPSYVIYNSDVQFFNNLFHVINFSG